MTEPKTEREWLAELREAASSDPVDVWLLAAIDERLAELAVPTLEAEIRARTGTERAVLAVRLPDGAGPEWAAGRRVRLTLLPDEEDGPDVD